MNPRFLDIWGIYMKNSVLFYSKSSLGFALIALLSFGSIFSISADEDEDSAEVAEEIVVTGSRIKRADNISSPTPMVTLGEDQIENTGSVNVYDILNELPQAGEALSRGNTNFTVGSSGVQTVNLRGLGSGRTLTLVNGRSPGDVAAQRWKLPPATRQVAIAQPKAQWPLQNLPF